MSKGMKLFIKLVCFVVVLAVAGPFILKGPDGRPLLSIERVAPGLVDSFYKLKQVGRDAQKVARDVSGDKHLGETKVYRTTDEQGTVQFTNIEPADKENYEVIWVDPDTNLIKGEPVPPKDQSDDIKGGEDASSKKEPTVDDALPPMLTVSPEKVEKLIEDAKNLHKMAEERAKIIEEL